MTWFRKAADQGNAAAQNDVGWLYANGWGVKQDDSEAKTWYGKAADQGNVRAEVNIGWLYQNGRGVKQDYSEALNWYTRAANQGDAQAQNNLGWLYENGLGADRDYAVAMAWYYRAADHGQVQAQRNLGRLYRDGLGDRQDYLKAMNWFRKAADQGDAGAEISVGWLYENGYGVKQDFAEAMSWYRKAAAQGNADAQNNVGWLYQNGWGVKQDETEALTWYRKAAEQGNSRAKANLESLSRNGGLGGPTNTVQNETATSSASEKASVPAVVPSKGIQPPRPIYQPEPQFSEEARKAMFTGEVVLALTVGPDGQSRDIRVVAPLGGGLDEKAVDAVKTWKFEPATKDGKPVAVEIMIEVDFGLRLSGVGKVDVISNLPEPNLNAYLSPLIRAAGQCWSNAVQDKTSAPAVQEGQVTIQFAVAKDGKAAAIQVVSSSGDAVLDRDANDCVVRLRAGDALPAGLQGNDLVVHMQLLYNMAGASLNPGHAEIAAGGREQFYIEMAGVLSKAVDWSVTGVGCKDAACGTISPDGLYTAPDVLPKPALVRVRGTLAGANPIAATAVVMLMNKR